MLPIKLTTSKENKSLFKYILQFCVMPHFVCSQTFEVSSSLQKGQ